MANIWDAIFGSAISANRVLASPNGSAGPLTPRALVAADLPGGTGTVTSVAQTFTGGLISVAGSPITTSGTLALTVAGTSGGVPYFSSTSAWASSALLASGGLVLGGGAGNPPLTNIQLTFSAPTLTVGLAGTSSGILSLAGSTSGAASITAPATAGTVTNPLVFSNAITLPLGTVALPSLNFAGATTTGFAAGTFPSLILSVGGVAQTVYTANITRLVSGNVLGWSNGDPATNAADTGFSRFGAASLALGNGTASNGTGLLSLGRLQSNTAGAASASAVSVLGAPFTGGSGTTTFPLIYANSGVTAPTTFSTAGTFIGFNAPSGFTGNFFDCHVNGGSSLVTINSAGTISASGSILSTASITAGAAALLSWTGRSRMLSPADGLIQITNAAQTGFTRLQLGLTTSSGPAFGVSGTSITAQLGDGTSGGSFIASSVFIMAATLSPTSAGTAGVTGQIAWDSGKIYVCTAGGVAGAATWKAANLTAV